MRRYLQGTLDFDCAVYAFINARALMHEIDLAAARNIYQQTLLALSANPMLWKAFVRNETDHYFLVRHLLSRFRGAPLPGLRAVEPFCPGLLWSEDPSEAVVFSGDETLFYRNPDQDPRQSKSSFLLREESLAVWRALSSWLTGRMPRRAALLRFLRYLPGHDLPIVSHWTTGDRLLGQTLLLHDASSEKNALLSIEEADVMPPSGELPLVYIEPQSVVLLQG